MTTSPDLSGTVLGGRYRLRALLGRGGMGSVYAAVQEDLGRNVAVKILDPLLAGDPGQLERFRREALASAALGHPNIVQVTDFSAPTNHEPPFLVMELLAGQSLGQLLDRESVVSPQRIAFIASQLLSALGAAHAAGIVHRDIKPDNVFLVSTSAFHDLVKVLDFGIAKLATEEGGVRLTGTGAMLGTPAYMAPEQARGAVVDHRADLYAVGATMYQALAGRLPHDAPSFPAMLFAIVEQTPEPLGRLRPDLPPSLVAVVERAMAKDPNARFRSAEEMRASLAPFVPAGSASAPGPVSHDAPTLAGDPSAAPQPTPVIVRSNPPPSGTPISSISKTPSPMSSTRSAPPPPGGGGLVKAAAVVVAGLVVVALIGGGTLVMLARARNDRDALRDYEARDKTATAATATGTGAAIVIGTPLPSATAEGSTARPLASSKVATAVHPSSSASALAPVVSVVLAPPPSSGKPYGGTSGFHAGGSFGECPECDWEGWNAAADAKGSPISACFKASEFEPPHHEYPAYVVHVNADGKFGVIEVSGDRTPNLDACLMGVIRSIPLVKPRGGPGSFQVSFTGRCKTFECK